MDQKEDRRDDSKFVCEFCGNSLSSSSSLNRHIKTSKICIEMRGEHISNIQRCIDCGYNTTLSSNLSRHLTTCKDRRIRIDKERSDEDRKREHYIIKLETENAIQKQQLLDEKSNPRIINNQLNITFNLQLEHSQRILSSYSSLEREQSRILQGWFSQSDCKRGIKGLGRVIINKILSHQGKQWMISYEPNKTAFHRKNDNEEIEVDDRAEKFFESLMPAIRGVVNINLSKLMNDATTPSEVNKVDDLRNNFQSMFEKGTPERKKIVRMIADSLCISKASLLSAKMGDSTMRKARIEFCDDLDDSAKTKSDDWFSVNDPEFLKWKESGGAPEQIKLKRFEGND